jgi:hypothetical protein
MKGYLNISILKTKYKKGGLMEKWICTNNLRCYEKIQKGGME